MRPHQRTVVAALRRSRSPPSRLGGAGYANRHRAASLPPSCAVVGRSPRTGGGHDARRRVTSESSTLVAFNPRSTGARPGTRSLLRANGGQRAFLSGPIALRRGVTLVVDTNVVLFASRDPREYDIDGRCGTVDKRGARLQAVHQRGERSGAGIMGPGTIDGRGWAKLIGRDVIVVGSGAGREGEQSQPELPAPDPVHEVGRRHAVRRDAQELAELSRRVRSRETDSPPGACASIRATLARATPTASIRRARRTSRSPTA